MNFFNKLLGLKIFHASLRVKVAIIFIIPVMAIMGLLSYFHTQRESNEIQRITEESAVDLSQAVLAGLNHAFQVNDKEMTFHILMDMKKLASVKNMRVVSSNAIVYSSSDVTEIGTKYDLRGMGCIECHQYSAEERPRAMRLVLDETTLRVATVIPNETTCQKCHESKQAHLGILLVDSSLQSSDAHLREDAFYSIVISGLMIIAVMALSYFLIQWLIVRRIDVIRRALIHLGRKDFSTRVDQKWRTTDELTQLGDYFNELAATLDMLQSENHEKERVRALAIIEERERIARELHDGLAQFLAYLSTKIAAIRLQLKNNRIELADKNLLQAEESIKEHSTEVRSSIIGLKLAGGVEKGLAHNVREYINQCNHLDEMIIELEISEEAEQVKFDLEKELQLLRILQESTSNIRKHSQAGDAFVSLKVVSGQFQMVISDNGVGFDPFQIGLERVGHFGLQIIFERANEIGAHVDIQSGVNKGTTLTITMKLSEN